jgi:hypothetical protein
MVPATLPALGFLRHSRWDALLVLLALVHAALALAFPIVPVIALGLWWNSNTIAHYFIHKPFFRSRTLNLLFSLYLSVLLGVPQTIWRQRHLAHHAGVAWRLHISPRLLAELSLILALWTFLIGYHARFFLTAYVPGYLIGLLLCWLHGYYEHVSGTTSHYGAIYNFLFFNDGYHVEHHHHPGEHWTRLPRCVMPGAPASRWPAVLRWLDAPILEWLERCVLHSRRLQRFVLKRHEQAVQRLLAQLPPPKQVGIVGGGLFPRTLLVLQRLMPQARLTVIDRSAANIQTARTFVNGQVQFINAFYEPGQMNGFDLLVVPLSFVGDREAIYRHPPAPAVLVHDWIWRKRGSGTIVSVLLLKRLNLVKS